MTSATTIGSTTLLDETPTVVTVDGSRYILHRDDDGDPVLYTATCPHQGGRVKVADEATLRCPTHRWEFDPATGECIRRGDKPLDTYEVTVEGDEIRAVLG